MPRCCWGCDGTFPIFVSETHLQDNPNMRIYILMGCINSDGKLLMVFICRLLLLLWGVATASTLKKNEPLTKTAKNGHKNRRHKNSDDSLSCGWTCNYRASPTTKTVEKAQFCIFCSSKRNSHNFQVQKEWKELKEKMEHHRWNHLSGRQINFFLESSFSGLANNPWPQFMFAGKCSGHAGWPSLEKARTEWLDTTTYKASKLFYIFETDQDWPGRKVDGRDWQAATTWIITRPTWQFLSLFVLFVYFRYRNRQTDNKEI